MATTLFGTKLGMTRVFTPEGNSVPVTVIRVEPNVVTQIRTVEKDGYSAVQVAAGDMKPRNSTIPMIGHDAKAGSGPKRHHGEFRVDAAKAGEFTLGQSLGLDALGAPMYVDVIGTSKGKGFQGTMKRHNFKGLCASHGTERKHRSPGSIGSHGTDRGHGAKIKKGKRMSGRMGDAQVTCRSVDVVKIDSANNLLLVKGAVPGANDGILLIKTPSRLYKRKARVQAGAA